MITARISVKTDCVSFINPHYGLVTKEKTSESVVNFEKIEGLKVLPYVYDIVATRHLGEYERKYEIHVDGTYQPTYGDDNFFMFTTNIEEFVIEVTVMESDVENPIVMLYTIGDFEDGMDGEELEVVECVVNKLEID